MKTLPRLISKQIGRFMSPRRLFEKQSPVFLPFYHIVSDSKLPYILNYPYRNSTEFEKELDIILKYFRPVSLEQLVNKSVDLNQSFHLSFDDGLKQCAEIITPVLLRKGIPATFFVNDGFIDNKQLFHRYKASLILNNLRSNPNKEASELLQLNNLNSTNILQVPFSKSKILDKTAEILNLDFDQFLETETPYLSTPQIQQIQNQGFTIAAHSTFHPEMWTLSAKQQFEEIKNSVNRITEKFHPKIKAFSFPFTDDGIKNETFKKLFDQQICDVTFGTAGLKYDSIPNHFQRYPVEKTGYFILNLKEEWVYFKLRKQIGKATVIH